MTTRRSPTPPRHSPINGLDPEIASNLPRMHNTLDHTSARSSSLYSSDNRVDDIVTADHVSPPMSAASGLDETASDYLTPNAEDLSASASRSQPMQEAVEPVTVHEPFEDSQEDASNQDVRKPRKDVQEDELNQEVSAGSTSASARAAQAEGALRQRQNSRMAEREARLERKRSLNKMKTQKRQKNWESGGKQQSEEGRLDDMPDAEEVETEIALPHGLQRQSQKEQTSTQQEFVSNEAAVPPSQNKGAEKMHPRVQSVQKASSAQASDTSEDISYASKRDGRNMAINDLTYGKEPGSAFSSVGTGGATNVKVPPISDPTTYEHPKASSGEEADNVPLKGSLTDSNDGSAHKQIKAKGEAMKAGVDERKSQPASLAHSRIPEPDPSEWKVQPQDDMSQPIPGTMEA